LVVVARLHAAVGAVVVIRCHACPSLPRVVGPSLLPGRNRQTATWQLPRMKVSSCLSASIDPQLLSEPSQLVVEFLVGVDNVVDRRKYDGFTDFALEFHVAEKHNPYAVPSCGHGSYGGGCAFPLHLQGTTGDKRADVARSYHAIVEESLYV